MKPKLTLTFLELLLDYLVELKTNCPKRAVENASVPLGFPQITWERETRRMNFPQPRKWGR